MNKNLYNGLKAIAAGILGTDQKPVFKTVSMWNNQLSDERGNKVMEHNFRKPAIFFEFQPDQVDTMGNGVQVFEPLPIRVHLIDELFDSKDGTGEVNLQVFDYGDLIYRNFQLKQVTGAAFGCSPLNRTSIELDVDHDNLYHHVTTFTTTWTDNSMSKPVGGYDIDPPLLADITVEIVEPDSPEVNVNPTSLDFGNVVVGVAKILTFVIDGEFLENDIIVSTSDIEFKISLSTHYSTRLVLPIQEEKELIATTVNVRWIPTATGAKTAHLNYGIPGLNNEIILTGNGTNS